MHLEIGTFPVRDVVFARQTRWDNGVLEINKDEMLQAVRDDPRVLT
ncbi:MAG: betaine reductase, partial [Chloroflexi bacterium]|nr:betaine reductase [Chloroflexota bacterium]